MTENDIDKLQEALKKEGISVYDGADGIEIDYSFSRKELLVMAKLINKYLGGDKT